MGGAEKEHEPVPKSVFSKLHTTRGSSVKLSPAQQSPNASYDHVISTDIRVSTNLKWARKKPFEAANTAHLKIYLT